MGGVETKLKLLACQRNDQSWSIVPGNEFITTDNASDFGEGALLVVDLGATVKYKENQSQLLKELLVFYKVFPGC